MRNLPGYLCVLMLTGGAWAQAAELRVEVSNADPAQGLVYFGLYDSAAGYQERELRDRARSGGEEGIPFVLFTDLPPGDYAVAVFQDTNGNGELDTNILGMPTEPFGFSQNVMGRMGRPDFTAAAISVPASDERLVIDIILRNLP